ncbi:MAG: polysaccharide pyruvyl transferase family protein [Bacteroidetes bacterium]|nr:polysaccharide pyruvyl transferase family protein [Bacteroidota bacterium]
MKIGVVTYFDTQNNYGQVLQAYALQTYLRDKGHEVFLIKYMPTRKTDALIKKIILKIFDKNAWKKLLGKVDHDLKLEKKIAKRLKSLNKELDKERCFENFKNQFVVSTNKTYNSIVELRENPPIADAYICGSDQVWRHPLKNPNTAGWFLSFGDKNIKRISYAASIGRVIEENEMKIFTDYLSAFDAISVREKKGLELCKSAGYVDTALVLDPTLLLDANNYLKLCISKEKTKNYVFLYFLNVATSEEVYWNEIKQYVSQTDLDVRIVTSSGYFEARELIPGHLNIQATISEWLGYIKDAESVITTSFHGMVFCILFEKPFLVIPLRNRFASGNIRIYDFLKEIGLRERVYDEESGDLSDCMNRTIDWKAAKQKLEELKINSEDFIATSI